MERDRMAKTEEWKVEQKSDIRSVIARTKGTDGHTAEVLIAVSFDHKGPNFVWRNINSVPLHTVPSWPGPLADALLQLARDAEYDSGKPNEHLYMFATVRLSNHFTFERE